MFPENVILRQDDLMVGDIVMYHPERIDGDNTREPYPVRIQIVDIEDNELFEPIPLTVEILEKNGYVLVANDGELINRRYLPYFKFEFDNIFWRGNQIQYVHQVQHILRLVRLFDEANDFVIK